MTRLLVVATVLGTGCATHARLGRASKPSAAPSEPIARPAAPPVTGDAAAPAAPSVEYHYLDPLGDRVVGRVIKTQDARGGGIDVTIAVGAATGVELTWNARVLERDTDTPLAGGELTVLRVDRRVTIAHTQLSRAEIEANPRVRLVNAEPLPPGAPSAGCANAPHGMCHVEIRYTYGAMHCSNRHSYTIDWTGSDFRDASGRAIDASLLERLRAAAADTRPSDHEETCNNHTDDYPQFALAFGSEPASPAAVITSTSNCRPDNAPWNVVRGDRRFVQQFGDVGDSVYALLAAVDPERWKVPGTTRFPWYQGCEPRAR
jgi:hypothetical protein